MRHTTHALATALLPLLLTVACGGADSGGDPGADGVDTMGTSPAQADTGGSLAVDRLPPSIVGEGGEPTGEHVSYYDTDPATRGYLAVPEGAGPFPAVILIHEWDGLVDRVRQFADDLAQRGYVALAADLYSGRTGSTPEENQALMEEVSADQQAIIANLDAAARFLRGRDDVSGRIATIGFCFGGGIALSYAIGGEQHEGTAIFYGRLITDPAQLRSISHPIHGTFAAEDQGIPPAEVERFVEALRSAGVENDVHIYDGVNHGFWLYVDERPEVRAEPAAHAWDRLQRYLRENLGG